MRPEFCVGLEIRRAGKGRGDGLFLAEAAVADDRVLSFGGPQLGRAQYESFEDFEHCLQIGVDEFLGPSGELDDFANHCCEPSTRVEIERKWSRAYLVARHDLRPGAEVTFDYSSVQLRDSRFRIEACRCGADTCRGMIGDFSLLDWHDKERLVLQGLCPWYVVEAFLAESASKGITLPAPPQR